MTSLGKDRQQQHANKHNDRRIEKMMEHDSEPHAQV
jgi:hypothetical protein